MKKMMVRRQKIPAGYYTVADVAEILRVTTRTVHTYLHKDGLPYSKVGKNVDLIDVYQIKKGSNIEREINRTGVTIYEQS